jgi:hypothetical protein
MLMQERVVAALHRRAQRLVASSERFCRMACEFDEVRVLLDGEAPPYTIPAFLR